MSKWTESADLAARYRDLYDRNSSASNTAPSNPPSHIQTRLDIYQLHWTDLHPLLKNALLWDAGYVRYNVDKNSIVQIYTLCDSQHTTQGNSMANVAVTMKKFLSTNASETVLTCESAQQTYCRQQSSQGPNISKVSKCTIPPTSNYTDGHSSMWAQDALGQDTVPDLRVFAHASPSAANSWLILSIHVLPNSAGKEAIRRKCYERIREYSYALLSLYI